MTEFDRTEHRKDEASELHREIQRIGRRTLIHLSIRLGILNAVTFTAYAIVLTR